MIRIIIEKLFVYSALALFIVIGQYVTFVRGQQIGKEHYRQSKSFYMTLESQYRFGYQDGYSDGKNNRPFAPRTDE